MGRSSCPSGAACTVDLGPAKIHGREHHNRIRSAGENKGTLYYTTLHCAIPYTTALFCSCLSYTIAVALYSTLLYGTALHYSTRHYTTLHCTTLLDNIAIDCAAVYLMLCSDVSVETVSAAEHDKTKQRTHALCPLPLMRQ